VSLSLVSPQITGWIENNADIHPVRLLCRNDAAGRPTKPAS